MSPSLGREGCLLLRTARGSLVFYSCPCWDLSQTPVGQQMKCGSMQKSSWLHFSVSMSRALCSSSAPCSLPHWTSVSSHSGHWWSGGAWAGVPMEDRSSPSWQLILMFGWGLIRAVGWNTCLYRACDLGCLPRWRLGFKNSQAARPHGTACHSRYQGG